MKQLQLTLNCEIEKYKAGQTYYCTYKEYDLTETGAYRRLQDTEKSSINFDEAEEKLINRIHKFCELEMWNKDLKLEIKINYK